MEFRKYVFFSRLGIRKKNRNHKTQIDLNRGTGRFPSGFYCFIISWRINVIFGNK